MSTTFLYQDLENGLQAYTSFSRTDFAALELDPAFVKAIQHLHPRQAFPYVAQIRVLVELT